MRLANNFSNLSLFSPPQNAKTLTPPNQVFERIFQSLIKQPMPIHRTIYVVLDAVFF